MKLQRTTLILLVSALLMGGFVYFYEVKKEPQQETAKDIKKPIFLFKQDQIQSVTIYLNQEIKKILKFERVEKDVMGWQMKYPKDVPASNAAVAFLLDLVVEGKSDRSFTVPADQIKEYGLDKPQAIVKVELNNKETHRIMLGKPDFNRSLLYAQVDPWSDKSKSLQVLLVPIDFEYAVNRPISEWQQTKAEDSNSSQELDPEQSPSPEPDSEQSPSPTNPGELLPTEEIPSP